ncbi:hypothetical protein ACFVHB_18440 [Kitasatospora sp. NPDC127111]|uniref:hypothetical protein n=1 Tax=Kitasatospora sp. NPDC127111 TaxID=3345363 RepID=UPI003637EECF
MADAPASHPAGGAGRGAARYRRHRVLLAAVSAAVVAAAGGGLWWWSARDPLTLPATACWSLLDRNDLRPLTDRASGTFGVRYAEGPDGGSGGAGLRAGGHDQTCLVQRDHSVLLDLKVGPLTDLSYHVDYGPGAVPVTEPVPRRLDLGQDVQGWMWPDGTVHLAFRCENPVADGRSLPYAEVRVWGDSRLTDPTLPSMHRARLDIALKAARAAVTAYPCHNPVAFPAAEAADRAAH